MSSDSTYNGIDMQPLLNKMDARLMKGDGVVRKCNCTYKQVCHLCPESKKQALMKAQGIDSEHPAKTLRAINRKMFLEIKHGLEVRLHRKVSRREVQAFVDMEAAKLIATAKKPTVDAHAEIAAKCYGEK